MPKITAEELQLFAKYIFELSGIHLEAEKGYLLENRLAPLLSAHTCGSYGELYDKARADQTCDLQKRIIEAISTNETYFFRDNTPFELIRNKIIPELIDRRSQHHAKARMPIRIWSAACSTGQEVYSIAMTLAEMLPDPSRYEISILGTDISDKVIARASYGKYNQFEIARGLPLPYRHKYFIPMGDEWRVNDRIRIMAQFRKMNLMGPFTDLDGSFDLIFCRNVAIYFNLPDKIRLFQKIGKVLRSDGALIVGGSETLSGIAPEFTACRYLRGVYYQLKGPAAPGIQLAEPVPLPAERPPLRTMVHPARHSKVTPIRLKPEKTLPVDPAAAPEQGTRSPLAEETIRPPRPEGESHPGSTEQATPAGGGPAGKKSLLASLRAGKAPDNRDTQPQAAGPQKISLLETLRKKKKE